VVKNKYIYNYTDHLGNVRLSYTKGASGGAEIIEENNYYPFGLKHQGYNSSSLANNAYQYKYNGKELQETGMYDYGARMYMPELGRWGVVDPLAEKMRRHSPYNYAFNNPIRFIDPDGNAPFEWVRKTGQSNWEYLSNITSEQQARDAGYIAYANGQGDKNSKYTTTLARNGVDTGEAQAVVLGKNGNYTVNGESFTAPNMYNDTRNVDGFGKFMAGFVSFPMVLESLPSLFSAEGLLIKGAISTTGQAAVNQNLDVIDLGADMFTVPGVSGGIGGAYDFNILPDQNGQHFFNNSNDYKKIGVNAATSLLSSGLGNRFSSSINTIQNTATKNTTNYIIETNYNIVEQSLNKAYEKKQNK
ncbi:RHS repeat domain-containing protein, partial [Elizabethkingia anophelis]|uniref:RHS repeat domain-containing protein n=1 Tax=Elizabethkingia anophelis TaxID=1117645 RepID=UPI003891918D